MINVISNTFKKEVIQSDKPVVVDFWATWCGPCKMLTPVLDDFSNKLNAKFVKVDVDENSVLSSTYMITSIPTVLIFKNGIIVNKFMGFKPPTEILKIIEKHIK